MITEGSGKEKSLEEGNKARGVRAAAPGCVLAQACVNTHVHARLLVRYNSV